MKMQARHKLGRLLAVVVRGAGRPKNNLDAPRPNFSAYIKEIGLRKQTAQEAQRIGTLPDPRLTVRMTPVAPYAPLAAQAGRRAPRMPRSPQQPSVPSPARFVLLSSSQRPALK